MPERGFYGFPCAQTEQDRDFRASGKPGATAGADLAGGTTSGAPVGGGPFEPGNTVVGHDGSLWVYTTAGTWAQIGPAPRTAGALAAYAATRPLTVTTTTAVTGSTTTPVASSGTDYVVRVHLSGATAAAVYGALFFADGRDLAIFWTDGSSVVHQLDVDVETVSATSISLWFRLQQNIGSSSSDTSYTLAYGNPNPTLAQNWATIYPLADDFAAPSLDTTKWTNYNGVQISVSGSVLTLWNSISLDVAHNGCAIQSVALYGAGYALRAKGTMPMPAMTSNTHVHTSLRFTNGDSSQLPGGTLRCQAQILADPANGANVAAPHASDWVVVSFDDDGSGHFGTEGDLGAVDGSTHTFNLGRAPSSGDAYAWIDEGSVVHTTDQSCTTAGHVWLSPSGDGIPSTTQQTWDWIKVRPFVAAEPSVSAGAESTTWQRSGAADSIAVAHNGSAVGTRPTVNLVDGTNVTLTVADNSGGSRVDVTVASTSGTVSSLLVLLPNPYDFVSNTSADYGQPPDFILTAAGDVIGVGGG